MAAKKTENGQEYTASDYLHVPDPESPSTWKLRIKEYVGGEKKVTRAQLGRAAAAMGPGFRGSRVQMPPADRAAAMRKLRAMYKDMGVDADAMPAVMQQALHVVAAKRMRRNAKKMAEALRAAGGDHAALAAEVAEDLEMLEEGSYYGSMIAAVQDGTISFETILCAAQCALDERHKAEHLSPEHAAASPGMSHPYDCAMKLVATFPGALVYEMKGKLYQVSYGIEGTMVMLGTDAAEVTAEFVPVAGEGTHAESKAPIAPSTATVTVATTVVPVQEAQDFWEARPAGVLAEARVNKAERVIEGCVLLNAESSNGPQGRRVYTDGALRQVAQMAEGLPAYANHVAKELAFQPRDVKTIIGRHRNPRFDSARHRVTTDLHVLEHQAPWVMALAEDLGDVVGNSLVSRGFARMENGVEVIDRIDAVRSGDLVSDPATTKGLFEHQERWRQAHGNDDAQRARPAGGDGDMEITLTAIVDWLKTHAAEGTALREHVAGEALATAAKEKADLTVKLTEAVAAAAKATAELTEAKTKLDKYDAATAVQAKRTKLQKAVAAHDLGKRFGKVEAAVSELFLTTCLEQDEAKWAGLFDDRVKLLDGAARGSSPQSQLKQESDALPAGIHGRLVSALVG